MYSSKPHLDTNIQLKVFSWLESIKKEYPADIRCKMMNIPKNKALSVVDNFCISTIHGYKSNWKKPKFHEPKVNKEKNSSILRDYKVYQ